MSVSVSMHVNQGEVTWATGCPVIKEHPSHHSTDLGEDMALADAAGTEISTEELYTSSFPSQKT